MIKRVDHVHVVAKDMGQSIDFYTRVLGFRLVRRLEFGPPDRRRQLSYVGLGDMLLELVQPSHEGEFLGTEARPLGLAVDDLDSTVAQLKSSGVEVVSEPATAFSFGGRQAVIRDPSGLAIELREWDPADLPPNPDWEPERSDVVRLS